jgi:probable phosphoglycerate mutase
MRLILTRHGETEENVKGIRQGHMPGKLTEKGIEQAKKLALRLKDEKIDAIYSSDLARAADTTKEIAEFHPNVKIEFTEKLRERGLGSFTGTKREDTMDKSLPSDAESNEAVKKRAKDFIDEIYEKHKDDAVLLMGHGAVNCAIISAITGDSFEEMFNKKWGNTGVNIFEIHEDRSHKIHCLNCVKHLEQP